MGMDDDRTTNPHHTMVTNVGAPKAPATDRSACLIVIYGDNLGHRVPLGADPVVIGRSAKCDVQIDQESVSRNHCRVSFDGASYGIRDLGSTNGTYVNDDLVEQFVLRDGDQLKIGRTILKFILGSNIEGQYHEEIYRLMTVDGLTQVHNRRFFEESLEKEISRAARYDRAFAIILFDIDYFKRVNDSFGHLAGDAVLRQLGGLIKTHVRRDDTVARTGGEEFGILCPEIGKEGATELAEKLRRLVAGTHFDFEGTRMKITISLGIAEWTSDRDNASALMSAADAKLYEAKDLGRDQSCA